MTQLTFVDPLPGFPDQQYTLDPIDPAGLLHSLRSVEHPELRFVLAQANAFFPEYSPELSDALAEPLGSHEVDVLLVVTLGSGLQDATANLRAPIAVARTTDRALQVILDDESLPMQAALVAG